MIKTKQDIEQVIANMTLEEKIGQTLVIGFVGTVMTPRILKRIAEIRPAGVRCSTNMRMKGAGTSDKYKNNQEYIDRVVRMPQDGVKDYLPGIKPAHVSNEQYCELLNDMKRIALNTGAGIPLHITLDMEGDGSNDYVMGGCKYFPAARGMAESGDTELPYKVGYAIGRQLSDVGFSWVHSPVADINTDPKNPEIGSRSFGENVEDAIPFLLQSFRGLKNGGLICTAKHFPGRGASNVDAHFCLPQITLSENEMREHLKSFQALIDAGVPAIMTAHTAYPALDPSGLPATLSKVIVTDLLKGKMGFEGVVTTDDITMGGIVENFSVHEGCINAINAGCDLILFRDESSLIDEVYPKLVQAAKNGEISEERLNDAVRRTLRVKLEYGLFEDGGIKDATSASNAIRSDYVAEVAIEAAKKTTFVLRNEEQILPLDKTKNVLLIEQVHPVHIDTNDYYTHPSLLWEKCQKYMPNIQSVECSMKVDESDMARIERQIEQADVIVCTNYHIRKCGWAHNYPEELMKYGKPIVVITNTFYEWGLLPAYKNVIMEFCGSAETMEEIARLLFEG